MTKNLLKIKSQHLFYIFSSILVICISSYPFWQAGFYFDDAFNSQLPGILALNNQSLMSITYAAIKNWLSSSGRFFPLALVVTYLTWDFFYDLQIYRIFHWLTFMLSMFACGCLLWKITRQLKVSLIFFSLIPLFWSVSLYVSPLTSFAPLFAFVTLLIISSFYFFINYAETNRFIHLVLSLLLYILALLTYELGLIIPVVITILALNYFKNKKQIIKATAPFVIITSIYLIGDYLLRMHVSSSYDGVILGKLNLFCSTFLKQAIAPFPLTYFFIDPHHMFNFLTMLNPWFVETKLMLLSIILFAISSFLIYQLETFMISPTGTKVILSIGLSFELIPSILIGISSKYQQNLSYGIGYNVVFVQYIGLALICIVLISFFNHRFIANQKIINYFFRLFLSIIIGLGISIAFLANNHVVTVLNQSLKYPRALFESALQQNFIHVLPPSAVIVCDHCAPWDTANFIKQAIGLKQVIIDAHENNTSFSSLLEKNIKNNISLRNKDFYLLIYKTLSSHNNASGYVILSYIESIDIIATSLPYKIFNYHLKPLRVYCQAKNKIEQNEIIEMLANIYNIRLGTIKKQDPIFFEKQIIDLHDINCTLKGV